MVDHQLSKTLPRLLFSRIDLAARAVLTDSGVQREPRGDERECGERSVSRRLRPGS